MKTQKIQRMSDNLIPWEPGQSGNPDGRPKGSKNRSTIIRELLALNVKDPEGKDVTNEVLVNHALLTKALGGDLGAIKEIQDTVYGKIVDKSEQVHSFTQMPTVKLKDGKSLDLGDIGAAPPQLNDKP